MSKGSHRRPSSISKEEYDANFEAVFGKKELKQWEDTPRTGEGDRGTSGEVPPHEHNGRDVHTSSKHTEAEVEPTKEGEQ